MAPTVRPGSAHAPRCRLIYQDDTVREGVVRFPGGAIRDSSALHRAVVHARAGLPLWPATCDWHPIDLSGVRFATVMS